MRTVIPRVSKGGPEVIFMVFEKPVMVKVKLSNILLWRFVVRPWVLTKQYPVTNRSGVVPSAANSESQWQYGNLFFVSLQPLLPWKVILSFCNTAIWSNALFISHSCGVACVIETTKHLFFLWCILNIFYFSSVRCAQTSHVCSRTALKKGDDESLKSTSMHAKKPGHGCSLLLRFEHGTWREKGISADSKWIPAASGAPVTRDVLGHQKIHSREIIWRRFRRRTEWIEDPLIVNQG